MYANVVRYSDSNCQVPITGHSYFLGCAESVESYYAASQFSETLSCIAAPMGTLPIPVTGTYSIDM